MLYVDFNDKAKLLHAVKCCLYQINDGRHCSDDYVIHSTKMTIVVAVFFYYYYYLAGAIFASIELLIVFIYVDLKAKTIVKYIVKKSIGWNFN